jgi:hypothetical protein
MVSFVMHSYNDAYDKAYVAIPPEQTVNLVYFDLLG